jgi:hypothetical protein
MLAIMSGTTPNSTSVDLFTQDLHFESGGTIRADERRMADDHTDWRLAMFHVKAADDVHPITGRCTPSQTRPCAAYTARSASLSALPSRACRTTSSACSLAGL